MEADYTMVAEARGQRVLWFRRFGSYQGDWLLLSRDDDRYYIYKDSYGSCSGCDAIEGEFGYTGADKLTPDNPQVQEFIKDYLPFLEMRPEAALRVATEKGNIFSVLPRNRREWQDDFSHEDVGRQLALIIKADHGPLSASEILEIDNQETRREQIERIGAEAFVAEIGAVEEDREGENVLMRIKREGQPDYVFMYVKDPSTERRYVIRTDPAHTSVRAARAASFGMTEEQFEHLVIET
jgi:hypothetical protein